jgi:hypothetical protein
VPVQYKLAHGWHISIAGFTVPPAGPELRALITEQWKHMTLSERNLPSNALHSPVWPRRFEEERAIELARAGGRTNGRFNNVSHRSAEEQCYPPNATMVRCILLMPSHQKGSVSID